MNYWAIPAMICLFFGVDLVLRAEHYYYIVYMKAQAEAAALDALRICHDRAAT
jgi:hypothetical protein